MAAITAALIKQVREETGAGMMDVKKALTEADGDVARAKEIIRAKGIQAAGKREGRKAQEGTIASTVVESANGQTGYAVELNSETDFVAKTPKFVEFADTVLGYAVKADADSAEALLAGAAENGTVKEAVEEAAALFGEHVKVGQFAKIAGPHVEIYAHKKSVEMPPSIVAMIATDEASPFFTPIKLTFMVSLILSAPVILYQVWAFIAPALYKHERRLVVPLLVSSSLLFYIGMAFAYFVVFPLAFGFLANTAPEGVQVSTDIASYLSFVMALFMAFGVSFEVPVAIVLLCWMGITSPEDLRKKRPYVLVGAFVVGMLLTPPDVFSQTLLAIPMYCLFEIGVFFSRFYVGKGRNREEENDAEAESEKTEE